MSTRAFAQDPVTASIVDEAVAVLRDLIRIDTSNPPGNERPAAEYLAAFLHRHGVEATAIGPSRARANLVARVRGDGTSRPLLLVSHLDVVPAEPEGWRFPPFAGALADGFVWGRGAMDCKYRAVTHAMLLVLARRQVLPLRRDVIVAACADEELGGAAGMEWLADNAIDEIDAEFVLGEGGGGDVPAPDGAFCAVGTGEKGSHIVTVVVRGEGGHSLRTRSDGAVERAGEVLRRLANPHLGSAADESVRAMIDAIAARQRESVRGPLLGLLDDATRAAALRALGAAAPDLKRWLEPSLYDLVAVTGIGGGLSVHAHPPEVRITCNVRLLPGRAVEVALASLRRRLAGVDGVEISGVHLDAEASQSPFDTALYRAIVDVYGEVRPTTTVVPWLLGGATDVRFLRAPGRSVYGFFPSITDLPAAEWMSMTHGVNERVSVRNLAWAMRVLYAVMTKLCT
ncbi:MAG: M20/M25/M40 family metallo-hydrolase [Armatimonadetes bacterium]|nr:M20/M25/M40 family metallo-hydrolase [Armatimonadota bacterium]